MTQNSSINQLGEKPLYFTVKCECVRVWYMYVFVCMYVHVACRYVSVYVEARGPLWLSSSITIYLSF